MPDECTIAVDFRILPGMEPVSARQQVIEALYELRLDVHHEGPQLITPPLATAQDDPFALEVLEICREAVGEQIALAGVPYGTDASWLPAPSVVLGPGSIASAHAIDEHVRISEVVKAAEIYRRIMRTDFANG